MRRSLLLLVFLVASSASAQFTIGPRYSNYATDIEIDIASLESGRQSGFGIVGGYRTGQFVLDFQYDRDEENGLDLIDILPFELGTYSRDRAEVAVGWAPLPFLDLQAGLRMDDAAISGAARDEDFFDQLDIEHQALLAGVRVHTTSNRPFGLYGLARYFAGTIDFSDRPEADSEGVRYEAGVMIPLGQSSWFVSPGFEVERLETDTRELKLDTNRFFVNFVVQR